MRIISEILGLTGEYACTRKKCDFAVMKNTLMVCLNTLIIYARQIIRTHNRSKVELIHANWSLLLS